MLQLSLARLYMADFKYWPRALRQCFHEAADVAASSPMMIHFDAGSPAAFEKGVMLILASIEISI